MHCNKYILNKHCSEPRVPRLQAVEWAHLGFLKIAADKLGSYLRDELVMVGQVGAAVHAAVAAVARVQVGLERLGFRQLHHDCGGGDRIVRVGVCVRRRICRGDQSQQIKSFAGIYAFVLRALDFFLLTCHRFR